MASDQGTNSAEGAGAPDFIGDRTPDQKRIAAIRAWWENAPARDPEECAQRAFDEVPMLLDRLEEAAAYILRLEAALRRCEEGTEMLCPLCSQMIFQDDQD